MICWPVWGSRRRLIVIWAIAVPSFYRRLRLRARGGIRTAREQNPSATPQAAQDFFSFTRRFLSGNLWREPDPLVPFCIPAALTHLFVPHLFWPRTAMSLCASVQ